MDIEKISTPVNDCDDCDQAHLDAMQDFSKFLDWKLQKSNNNFLNTLKEIDDCANFLIKMTGCRKVAALKALFQIFAVKNHEDYSSIIAIVSEWC